MEIWVKRKSQLLASFVTRIADLQLLMCYTGFASERGSYLVKAAKVTRSAILFAGLI